LWGESVENLQVVAHLENGVVDISRFFADHPVGTVNVTGAVNVLDSTGDLGVDLQVPALARLKRFGLPGYGGAIAYSGVVEASWVDSAHIVGTTHGKIHGQRLKGAGAEVGLMNGSVTMELNGPAYSGTGTLRLDQVVADGLKIERLDLPFAGTWSEKEGGSGTVGRPESILARGVSIGDGAVGVTSVTGELRGGVDVAGVPFGRADVLLSDMLLGPAKLEAEGGPVTLVYEPEGVVAEIDLRRQDMPFLGGKVSGHPTDGNWVIDDLILAPSIDQRLEADGPVSFVLDEGGVRDLNLTLVKKSIVGQGDQAVDGDAQPFLALAGTLLPSDPMQTDLRAIMTEMNLAEVAKVVAMIDEAGTDGSHSLDGLKGLLNADLKLWGESGELAVDGQIKVGGLAIPGAMRADVEEGDYALAKRVDVDTVVWGTLSRPHVDLRVQAPVGRRPNKGTPREKEMMLALAGSFPLEEGPAGWRLDCRDAIDLQVVVPPGGTMRFRRLIQNLELPKGRMGAEMHMSGKACNPQMQFGGGGTFALGAGDEEVRLDWDIARNGDEVILESWLEHGLQRRLEVHGNLTARLNEVFEWALQDGEKPRVDDPLALVDQMALDILPMSFPLETLGAFGQLPEGLGGNIGGGLHLGGRPKKPVLTGGLVWVDGTLGGVRVEEGIWSMVPEQKGQDAVDDIVRSYHLESRLKFEGLGALSIVGTVPLMLNPNATAEQLLNAPGFALEITGEGLPLQVIAGSVEGLEDASGLVELSGTVAGTLAEPDINLKASMDGAAISSTETGVHYEDMKMELFLLSDRLFLQQLRFHTNPLWTRTQANTKDGALYARGYVILSEEDVNQVEFDLELDRAWMVNAEGNAVVLSGEMAVDGVWPNLAVTGAVVTDHGKIDLGEELFADTSDLDLDPILSIHREGMVQVDDEDLKGFEEPPFWEDFDVDMTFDMQRKMNLKVEVPMSEGRGGNFAQLANITMEMDLDSPEMLHIRLADGDISVDGEVEILKNGSMHVLTGTFDVSGGTLVFSGKDYTEPSMDLSAIRSTGKYGDVQATVTGTPSAPQLAFSSEEYPDQADVISLLLFGKPASEMADTEGEAGAALMGAALSSVTGQVSQAFESSVVGSLELEDGAVQVGMPLSEKLYLTYAIKTNADEDENVNQASLEWLIQRRMYAEFVTGDAGQSSADLYWRWRF